MEKNLCGENVCVEKKMTNMRSDLHIMYCIALNCKVPLNTVSFMLRKYAAIDQEGSVSQCNQDSELGQLRLAKV